MKLVYTHENRLLVSNVQNFLENAGIKTSLNNEFVGSASGDLSFLSTWPEVWVLDEHDYDAAMQLINKTFNSENNTEWICRHCNEINSATFDVCWNCEKENSVQV